jgi:hypothetical protein
VPKRSIPSVLEVVSKIEGAIGWTIQAQREEELPEQVKLITCTLHMSSAVAVVVACGGCSTPLLPHVEFDRVFL